MSYHFVLEIVTRSQLNKSQSYHKESDIIDEMPSDLDKEESRILNQRLYSLLKSANCKNIKDITIKEDEVVIGVENYFHWSRNPCGFFNGKGPRKIRLELEELNKLEPIMSDEPTTIPQKKITKLAKDIAKLFRIGIAGI